MNEPIFLLDFYWFYAYVFRLGVWLIDFSWITFFYRCLSYKWQDKWLVNHKLWLQMKIGKKNGSNRGLILVAYSWKNTKKKDLNLYHKFCVFQSTINVCNKILNVAEVFRTVYVYFGNGYRLYAHIQHPHALCTLNGNVRCGDSSRSVWARKWDKRSEWDESSLTSSGRHIRQQ